MTCRCSPSSRCGRCDSATDWWISFGLLWWLIAFEITEQSGHKRSNRFANYVEQLEAE